MDPTEDHGLVLRCRENGDNLLSIAFLSKTRGLHYPLLRKSKKGTRPDLFDTARITLSRAKQGELLFASDYTALKRRAGLALSYERLKIASRFAEIVRCNVQHLPDHEIIFALSEKLFDTLETEPAPEAAYLKTLYLFAKTEGFPIREDWVFNLTPHSRETLAKILSTPLNSQPEASTDIHSLTSSIEDWLVAEAHFILSR